MKVGNMTLTAGLLAIALGITLAGCGGGGKQTSTAAGNSTDASKKAIAQTGIKDVADILTDMVKAKGVVAWEKEITETSADRASGYIARKKTNLKITGPITPEQLETIGDALRSVEEETGTQLFRLDMSGVTGLIELPEGCFRPRWIANSRSSANGATVGYGNLGSLILPEGLKKIAYHAFNDQNHLIELHLPDSLDYIGPETIINVSLSKLVIPAKCALYPIDELYIGGDAFKGYYEYYYYDQKNNADKIAEVRKYGFSTGSVFFSRIDSTIVFKEGYEVINLGSFGDQNYNTEKPTYRAILPPSTLEFYIAGRNKAPIALTELYCYAVNPPEWHIMKNSSKVPPTLPLESVKTVYVPAGSIKAYEDAWFNYTGAEFKAIPANMATIDKWY